MKETEKKAEGMKTLEEWAKAKGTDAAVLEGTKAFKGWRAGKSVTEKEFDQAVAAFGKAPADGRK